MVTEKRVLSENEWGLIAILHELFLEKAKEAQMHIEGMEFNHAEQLFEEMRKILTELLVCFRGGTAYADELCALYLFVCKLIAQGFSQREPLFFRQATEVITPLWEAFSEVSRREEPKVISGMTYGRSGLQEAESKSCYFEG